MAVVGIDLGTTNTVIAAVRDGRATALKDKLGRALLPSVVSFSPKGGAKIGHEAKNRRTLDPENTVFSIKRLIGRTYDSDHVQKAIQRLPFQIKEGPGKSALVSCYGTDHTLPEISALVLEEAQKIGETRLGGVVADAVITVPANFNDLQRAATKVAGRTAGLEVLRIINEPTAAALAYGFGKKGRERIAVYDFGGGTFDVTILDLSENVFEVLATAGDTFLGGDDIDRAVMDRMAEQLLTKNKIDASSDNLVREQLRAGAEKIKIDLSTRSMGKTRIEDLDFDFTMRRSEFETLTEPLLAQTLEVCQDAMDVAGVGKKDLDQILLVGGSTRIPLVRRRISSFFGKMPQSRINPDEVVAIGAAIQASSLEAKQNSRTSIPAAPLPRAAAHGGHRTGAPPGTGRALGSTQTGLAGLKKTLAGTGKEGETTEHSVLSGMKSIAPAVHPAGTQKLGPAKTLSGVGSPASPGGGTRTSPTVRLPDGATHNRRPTLENEKRGPMSTLAGAGGEPASPNTSNTLSELSDRPTGNTNLGLGEAPGSPPPLTGQAPPKPIGSRPGAQDAEPSDFDDVTKVVEDPFDDLEDPRDKQDTIPGSAAPPSEEMDEESVTFDLAELEATQGDEDDSGFAGFEDETTQIVDPEVVEANAAALDQDASATHNDLPVPVENQREAEELGDSALIDYDELERDEADLPSLSRKPVELTDSSLLDAEDVGLPSVAAALPMRADVKKVQFDKTAVGLPAPVADLPARAAPLPQPAPAHAGSNLPATMEENLPLVGAGLPTRGTSGRMGFGKTQLAPGSSPGPDFDSIANATATGTVDELDELSVAALLPEEGSVATQLPGDSFDLGGTSPMGSRAPEAPAMRPQQKSVAEVLADASATDSVASAPLDAPLGPAPTEHGGSGLSHLSEMQASGGPPPTGGPLLLDVTPLSLGVEVVGGYVDQLIERNSPVPCERTRTFATASDNQQVVRVRVSQGEEGRFEENTVLGEIELTGLSIGPRGSVKVDVSFSLDESGMLQVSARDQSTGNAADARLMLAGVS